MSEIESRPQRLGVTTVASGKWLRLEEIEFLDHKKRRRKWESVARSQGQGAVMMIPILRPSNRYVLIQQYRPPIDKLVLEFPAGLIDLGEKPEETAVRELHEETGYRGTITWMSEPSYSSPGMSAEFVVQAVMEIDETRPGNQNPVAENDDGENIEAFAVGKDQICDFLRERQDAGVTLDSKIVAHFLGTGLVW